LKRPDHEQRQQSPHRSDRVYQPDRAGIRENLKSTPPKPTQSQIRTFIKYMRKLLTQISNCRVCEQHLEPRPVMAAGVKSKIIIIGQAPGRIVHETGIAWNDKSGGNLRNWMGIDKDVFYNTDLIALMPMGFCYPGKDKTGDLPPRPECAPLWHPQLLALMTEATLTLLIGQYAQQRYLGSRVAASLTETVRQFKKYLPVYLPLPHPSPRNNIWQAKNEWFKAEVLPELKKRVRQIINI
jgi:uracil-DNA glycosylase